MDSLVLANDPSAFLWVNSYLISFYNLVYHLVCIYGHRHCLLEWLEKDQRYTD
jgi:hypothetical protein